jgi:hypothetical protein
MIGSSLILASYFLLHMFNVNTLCINESILKIEFKYRYRVKKIDHSQ